MEHHIRRFNGRIPTIGNGIVQDLGIVGLSTVGGALTRPDITRNIDAVPVHVADEVAVDDVTIRERSLVVSDITHQDAFSVARCSGIVDLVVLNDIFGTCMGRGYPKNRDAVPLCRDDCIVHDVVATTADQETVVHRTSLGRLGCTAIARDLFYSAIISGKHYSVCVRSAHLGYVCRSNHGVKVPREADVLDHKRTGGEKADGMVVVRDVHGRPR